MSSDQTKYGRQLFSFHWSLTSILCFQPVWAAYTLQDRHKFLFACFCSSPVSTPVLHPCPLVWYPVMFTCFMLALDKLVFVCWFFVLLWSLIMLFYHVIKSKPSFLCFLCSDPWLSYSLWLWIFLRWNLSVCIVANAMMSFAGLPLNTHGAPTHVPLPQITVVVSNDEVC